MYYALSKKIIEEKIAANEPFFYQDVFDEILAAGGINRVKFYMTIREYLLDLAELKFLGFTIEINPKTKADDYKFFVQSTEVFEQEMARRSYQAACLRNYLNC